MFLTPPPPVVSSWSPHCPGAGEGGVAAKTDNQFLSQSKWEPNIGMENIGLKGRTISEKR